MASTNLIHKTQRFFSHFIIKPKGGSTSMTSQNRNNEIISLFDTIITLGNPSPEDL